MEFLNYRVEAMAKMLGGEYVSPNSVTDAVGMLIIKYNKYRDILYTSHEEDCVHFENSCKRKESLLHKR